MSTSKSIKSLRESLGLTQEEFAKKIGCSKVYVGFLEQGKRYPSSTLRKRICEVFNTTEPELFGGSMLVKEPSAHYVQKVPVISWVHANKFEDIEDPFPAGISDEYIYSSIKGENIFALRVSNDCMSPEFLEGDLIIVKPNVHITSGDYIIVADRDSNSATFKQYKEYGSKKIMHPLNPKYQDIELDHKKRYVIVGKIVAKEKKY